MHDFMIFLNHILPTISLLCCRACLFSFRSVAFHKKNFCLCLCLSMPRKKKTMYLPHNSARSRAQGFTERNQGPGRRMRLLIITNYTETLARVQQQGAKCVDYWTCRIGGDKTESLNEAGNCNSSRSNMQQRPETNNKLTDTRNRKHDCIAYLA